MAECNVQSINLMLIFKIEIGKAISNNKQHTYRLKTHNTTNKNNKVKPNRPVSYTHLDVYKRQAH